MDLKCNLIISFVSRPIRLHVEGGVYDLHWVQAPGGDRNVLASHFGRVQHTCIQCVDLFQLKQEDRVGYIKQLRPFS